MAICLYSKILMPLDGSATSFAAAEYAMKFAQEQNANITLLYVINERYIQKMVTDQPQEGRDELTDRLKTQGKKFFQATKKVAKNLGLDVIYDETILVGDPADEIINFTQKMQFDLIIMPSKDREHSPRFMVGHVTSRVIESGVAPVLTVPYHLLTKSPF